MTNSVDQARLDIFVTKYKPKKRICFSQPKSNKKFGFKYNATMFQSYIKRSSSLSMLKVSGRSHLGWYQHHIFLHHLVGHLRKTKHVTMLLGMLHQRSLRWLKIILALVMVSFAIRKYKIMVTLTLIIHLSFLFPVTRNFLFSNSNMIIL